MKFSLNSLGGHFASSECFYQVHVQQATFYSAVYPDKSAALLAMEGFVLRLRNRRTTKVAIIQHNAAFALKPFPKDEAVVHPGTGFTDKMSAIELLDDLLSAVQADTFFVHYMELSEPIEGVMSMRDMKLQNGVDGYPWVEKNTGTLRIGPRERGGATVMGMPLAMSSSVGVSPLGNSSPCEPIFNALQPQVAADLPFFMGRKQEVEDLYALTLNHRLLLLYGKARVGKSSLIQCGLANRMEAAPGELFVHCRKVPDILTSLNDALRAELATLGVRPAAETVTPLELLTQLQAKVDRPVYLVFDQLERLFASDVTEEERQSFFAWVQMVSEREELPCRIILSLREKYLAPLAEYETMLPSLLTHRLRVQTLNKRSMVDVSVNLLDLLKSQGKLQADKPELVAEKICSQLTNAQGDVPFQCLQIFMQEAHRLRCTESGGETPVFDPDFIERLGPAQDVISDFLNRKREELQAQLSDGDQAADPEVLQQIEDIEASQNHCGCGQSQAVVPVAVAGAAAGGGRNWAWLWPLLLAVGFGGLTYWVLNNWQQRQDPCYLAEQADTCAGYLNYLSAYGDEAPCAADFAERLAERQCTEWKDYQLLLATPTCGAYQNYFLKYRNTNVSTEMVQQRLLEWSCPLVRDTVEIRDTVTQTITVPTPQSTTGDRIGSIRSRPPSAGCKLIGGVNFKQVGPLFFMTDPLAGGPYSWEDALSACQAKGWRLPCIGEVDFLIDNIYRGQADRAFRMLSGSGDCFLFDPSSAPNRRVDFWTGTEANDAQAWSFYFDTSTNSIGRESNIAKSRALPCLCVKKEVSDTATDLPPCYNKRVDRQ